MNVKVIEKIKSAPKVPGVYIFYGSASSPQASGKEVLYVGKAANLRARLKSYLKITDIKTQSLHEEATRLSYIPLRSEIEALIEESRLIKELKPKYNVLWQDDKSYLYVAFTREITSKIFITHKSLNPKRYTLNPAMIGPFTDGGALRLVMKLLRRQFPYCTCLRLHLRDCLNAQIGLCLGICCKKGDLTRQITTLEFKYKHNIKMIKAILRGQSKKLLKTLEKPEERAALEKIFEHQPFLGAVGHAASSEHPGGDLDWSIRYQFKPNGKSPRAKKGLPLEQTYSVSEKQLHDGARVECYDISNFAGKEAVGAMTVLGRQASGIKRQEWIPDKSQWRKFKIKSAPTRDDPRMIYEVVSRRLNHPEWPLPDLMIIDGGIAQYNAARKALEEAFALNPKRYTLYPKLVAYPKPQKVLLGWPNAPEEIKKLAEQAIYQTHNFVIRYHRNVRRKQLFDIIK